MGTGAEGAARLPTRGAALRALAELFALTGLAITQPILDVFGNAPDVFLFRESDRAEIIAFALVIAVVPTLALFVVELLVGAIAPRARTGVHLTFLGGLAGLLALQLLKHFELTAGVVAVAIGLGAAVGLVLAYRRWAAVRLLLQYLGVAPVLFIAAFLLTSQTAELLHEQQVEAAEVAPARNARSVVFLQFDEWPLETILTPDGTIDRELYPNLAAVADEGTWYRNATTVANLTSYAVPAIMTGRYPEGEHTAVASEYPENLYTLLANEFDLDVVESATRLCPPNLCDGPLVDRPTPADPADPEPPPPEPTPDGLGALLDDAASTYDAMVSPAEDAGGSIDALREETSVVTATSTTTSTTRPEQGPSAEDAATDAAADTSDRPAFSFGGFAVIPQLRIEAVDQLTGSIEAGEDPTLHYLHLLLPHSPYRFLPSGQTYDPDANIADLSAMEAVTGQRSDDQTAVDVDRQRLVLQAMYVDGVIGDVRARLRETGLAEDTILVVVADHGVALRPGATPRPMSADALDDDGYADLLPVPMLISGPGIEPGRVDDANVETIDLVPTLADLLGIDIPWSVDGIPVTSEQRPDDRKRFHLVGFSMIGGSGVSGPIGFDGDPVLATTLERHLGTLFRRDNEAYRTYDLDPAGELVGVRVQDVPEEPVSGLQLTLEEPDALSDVDPESGVLRTHVVGSLAGAAAGEPITIAFALNGRIAAVHTTWDDDGDAHHVEAMLVPDFLRAGANDLTAYVVGGDEDARTLAPIGL